MSATLAKVCAVCKKSHTFYLPSPDVPRPAAKLVYHCRAGGIAVRLWTVEGIIGSR